MALALDEPKKTDTVADEQGYTFCMDNDLLEKVAHVTINYSYMGFSVDSQIPVNAGGSACGGCSSSGGCGGA